MRSHFAVPNQGITDICHSQKDSSKFFRLERFCLRFVSISTFSGKELSHKNEKSTWWSE
jgi:translation elongation factor EF-1alpha